MRTVVRYYLMRKYLATFSILIIYQPHLSRMCVDVSALHLLDAAMQNFMAKIMF